MRNVILRQIVLATVFGLMSCGSAKVSIEVDGFDVNEEEWKTTTHEISARLRFEHDCEGPYEFVLIKKQYQFPGEIGVAACGKKWIFSRTFRGMKPGDWKARMTSAPSSSRWVVSSPSDSDSSPPEAISDDSAQRSASEEMPGDDTATESDSASAPSSDAQPAESKDSDTNPSEEDANDTESL